MRNFSDKICVENQNTHFMFHKFSHKSCRLSDNVENYDKARETTDNNIKQCRALRAGQLRLQTHTQNI